MPAPSFVNTPVSSRLLFFLGLLLPAAATTAEPPVSLPAGALTFPELARRLSAPGREVTCDRRLRKRAAFLLLKPRPWPAVQRVLASSLDLRFEPVGAGSWQMRPDPGVEKREREWLERYVAYFRGCVDRLVAERRRKYESRSRPAWVAEREEQRGRLAALEEQARAGVEISREEYDRTRASVGELDALLSPATGALLRTLQGDWPARELLRRRWLLSTGPSPRLPALHLAEADLKESWSASLPFRVGFLEIWQEDVDRAWAQLDRRPYDWAVQGVAYDPVRCRLTGAFRLTSPDDCLEWDVSLEPASLAGVEVDAGGVFAALGPEAEAWLRRERQATERFLETERARRAFSTGGEARDLSERVEQWARAEDAEAVMELWPERETRYQGAPAGFAMGWAAGADPETPVSLRRLFTGLEGAGVNVPADRWNVPEQARFYARELPEWSLREQEGVLVVSNRLAFLDRLREMPLGPLLDLERRLQPPEGRSGTPAISYGALCAFCRSLSPEEGAAWGACGPYRGVPVDDLARAAPLVGLLDRVPARDRHALWARLRPELPHHEAVLPALLTPADRRHFVACLRAAGPRFAPAWHPRFGSRTADYAFDVELRTGDGPGTWGLWLYKPISERVHGQIRSRVNVRF